MITDFNAWQDRFLTQAKIFIRQGGVPPIAALCIVPEDMSPDMKAKTEAVGEDHAVAVVPLHTIADEAARAYFRAQAGKEITDRDIVSYALLEILRTLKPVAYVRVETVNAIALDGTNRDLIVNYMETLEGSRLLIVPFYREGTESEHLILGETEETKNGDTGIPRVLLEARAYKGPAGELEMTEVVKPFLN